MHPARFAALAFLIPASLSAQASTDSLAARASALFGAKDYRAAAQAYAQLTKADSTKPRYWYYLGTSRQLCFTAHSTTPQGPVVLVMSFAKIDANTVRQWGAVSIDDGKTWSSPWDLYYHRKHA